jgi:hypothetical protein
MTTITIPTLSIQRLTLRGFAAADLDALAPIYADPPGQPLHRRWHPRRPRGDLAGAGGHAGPLAAPRLWHVGARRTSNRPADRAAPACTTRKDGRGWRRRCFLRPR